MKSQSVSPTMNESVCGWNRGRGTGGPAVALWGLAAVLLAGCGADTYERRLEETRRYFEYRQHVEESLRPSVTIAGATIRPPRDFEQIRLPASDDEEGGSRFEGNAENSGGESLEDHMQRLAERLPELQGLWRAEVNVDVDGGTETAPVYLYLASNYEMFADSDKASQASEFHEEFTQELFAAIGFPLPEAGDWADARFPRGQGYVPRKSYLEVTLDPPEHGNSPNVSYQIYLRSDKDVQTALVFAIPANMNRPGKLREQIGLCLEQLNVTSELPRRGGKTSGEGDDTGGVDF